MSNVMKGIIGVAKRVHYLEKVDRPEYNVWASSACGSWAGRVEIVDARQPVTCGACKKLDPSKLKTENISNKPYEPGNGVF